MSPYSDETAGPRQGVVKPDANAIKAASMTGATHSEGEASWGETAEVSPTEARTSRAEAWEMPPIVPTSLGSRHGMLLAVSAGLRTPRRGINIARGNIDGALMSGRLE
jgi:hypothetical protein